MELQLGISAVTLRHFRAFLFGSRHERGPSRHWPPTDQIAEQIAWWRAFCTIFPELRPKPIFAIVGEQHGLSPLEVYHAFREIDPKQWKQISASADALAKEWAEARRRTDEARRRYADAIRRKPSPPSERAA